MFWKDQTAPPIKKKIGRRTTQTALLLATLAGQLRIGAADSFQKELAMFRRLRHHKKITQRESAPMFEAVEPRRLMSARLLESGTLFVLTPSTNDSISVMRQINGDYRVTENGVVKNFIGGDAARVNRVLVHSLNGNDRIVVNVGSIPTQVEAGQGNDLIETGSAKDSIYGGAGNDTISGGSGNDLIRGDDGNDSIAGVAGNDLIEGGNGNDSIDGGADSDTIYGGNGDDSILAGTGNDRVEGGGNFDFIDGQAGADRILGDAGDDDVRGGTGNDTVFGNDGNDRVYGGSGADAVNGGAGRDGLFGGVGSDTLTGAGGNDRFLVHATPGFLGSGFDYSDVTDRGSSEARIGFVNGSEYTLFPAGQNGTYVYKAKTWSDSEIENIDRGLGALHKGTGNARLLRQVGGGDINFVRQGGLKSSSGGTFKASGWNAGDKIHLTDFAFSSDSAAVGTTIHEIGHNWDTEFNESAWHTMSGWKRSDSKPTSNHVKGGDSSGKWWHLKTAKFVSSYAKTNPNEDFAESFEDNFLRRLGLRTGESAIVAKATFINNMVSGLA